MLGPIHSRSDFNNYSECEIPEIFWKAYIPHLEAIRNAMPTWMKTFCGFG